MQPTSTLSLVIPLYNEAENISALCEEIRSHLGDIDYEVLLVDDGSSDGSFDLLKQEAERDNRFKVVGLRRNFGQSAALAAGFDMASGAVVVTMDGDLQNDPADIPRLLEKLNEGYDVVSGWRRERKDLLVSRRIPSRLANWLISAMTR
ncbi:MAG: glycosyltransferase, partial [Desulfuromonas sp.]